MLASSRNWLAGVLTTSVQLSLELVLERRLVEPALELELRAPDAEAALAVARPPGARQRDRVVGHLVGEARLDAVRHLHVEVVAERDARLAVAPLDALDGRPGPLHRSGDAVLEEEQLERRLVVGVHGLAVRPHADASEADAGLAGLLEGIRRLGFVEDEVAVVLLELPVVQALDRGLGPGVRCDEHEGQCDARAPHDRFHRCASLNRREDRGQSYWAVMTTL